ncbi:MAG: hypothetical protein LBU79_07400 [Planctomycetota bacterium]|jgi:hypothetical protein|nr:hypothetical protein [Planctomycetota bacterium]
MQLTHDTYTNRVAEIDLYYDALGQLDKELTQSFGSSVEPAKKYRQDDFLKILKANALLMIYNLVESTVRNGIEEIYDKLKANGATYSTVRKEIQDIWFSYKFKQVYDQMAHYVSYKDKALEIVNSILTGEIIELNREALHISGNLDAEEIRQVCNNHGIGFKPDRTCKGGERLSDVKTKRNLLAHGTLSFSECGRDYSLEDLIEIRNQTYGFLTGLLDGMKKYHDDDGYLNT